MGIDITSRAKAIPKTERGRILKSIPETQLHQFLQRLFSSMEPDYLVEITHGIDEYGKDLVLVKKDKITSYVLAVVVKVGDVSGKTAGEVDKIKKRAKNAFDTKSSRREDEIISQVEQSLEHPAKLRSLLVDLPINSLIVVIAGNLSSNARNRIQNSVEQQKAKIEVWAIDDLVEKFTDYYAQVFFEGEYIDFCVNKSQELDASYVLKLGERTLTLSDYFIDPSISPLELFESEEVGHSIGFITKKKKIPFSNLASIINTSPNTILIGDPGVGKSGILAKYAIDHLRSQVEGLSRKSRPSQLDVPILVTANQVLQMGDDLDEAVKLFIGKSDTLQKQIRPVALLVDALDEVAIESRKEVLDKVDKLQKHFDCPVVITSRRVEIVEQLSSKYKKFEVQPFSHKEAMQFFERVLQNKGIASLDSLRDGLTRLQFQIPLVPLSLKMLVDLVEIHKEIPASVTELYERFFDVALGRFDKEKGIKVLFEYFIKKKFLASLAYDKFFRSNSLEIMVDDFDFMIDEYAKKYNWSPEISQSFRLDLTRSGILSIKETVTFKHRTFLDYFVAWYVKENATDIDSPDDLVAKAHFNSLWVDTAFFFVGLKREIPENLYKKLILENKQHNGLEAKLGTIMIGRLLQAGWLSGSALKLDGINNALLVLGETRELFLKQFEKDKREIPRIIADYVIFATMTMAFGSGFLLDESRKTIDQILAEPDADSNRIIGAIAMLWAAQKQISASDKKTYVQDILEKIKTISGASSERALAREDEIRMLLFLQLINTGDKDIKTGIENKLKRIARNSKEVIKKLLPTKPILKQR